MELSLFIFNFFYKKNKKLLAVLQTFVFQTNPVFSHHTSQNSQQNYSFKINV